MQPISAMTQEISIRIDRGDIPVLTCALKIAEREALDLYRRQPDLNAAFAAAAQFRCLDETLNRQEIQL